MEMMLRCVSVDLIELSGMFLKDLECRNMCGSSSICCNNNNWWYMPAMTSDFVKKGCVFYGFTFDSFCSKSIISVCKFYELYFDNGLE